MKEGERFSLVYLDRSTPLKDSERFRNRLASYYNENLYEFYDDETIRIIKRETGAELPYMQAYGYSLEDFFQKNELRDVLDSITLIFQILSNRGTTDATNWLSFVGRALSEESMGYRLDAKGGVHYHVDEEFERNRFSTLSFLENPKYKGTRAAYEDAYRYMDSHPPEERKKILARQKAGIERAREENRYVGGTTPYGISWLDHTIDDNGNKTDVKKWRINEVEYQVLQQAVQLIREGHTIQNVVDIFNADPVLYPPKRKKWSHASLWSMLCRSDFYFTGKMKSGLDTGKILFTEDEIQEVRHLVKLNRRNNGRKDNPKTKPVDTFLLQRLLRCECGWTLSSVVVDKGKYRYDRCKRCGYGINADQLDTDLWNEFTETFNDKDRLLAAVKAGDYALGTKETRQAKADLTRAEKTLEQVAERKRLIMRLLNDPNSTLDYKELKATLVELEEKAKEAKVIKQQAQLKLSNPDLVEKAVVAASKAMAIQLDEVDEAMATFASCREARRADLPVSKVKEQVCEQKRTLLREVISKGGGILVTKAGEVSLNGSLTDLKQCTG